jgi:Kdo2-lipid IVA lauroyltransferase/acyltransferase
MLVAACRLFAKLPLSALRGLGTAAGTLAYAASAQLRRSVADNLRQAGLLKPLGLLSPIVPKAVIPPQTMVRRVVQASARAGADMVWVWFNPPATVAARCWVDAASTAAVQAALAGKHPTLLLTPHLGCFEVLAKWFATQAPLTALYRPPNKPWVAALLAAARSVPQLTMARADAGGVRTALKTLKNGGVLGILPDQAPRHGEGVWLPWFGRDAYTITLPAKLQAATGARVFILAALPCDASRGKPAGWRIVCEPVAVPEGRSAEQVTLHLNQTMERLVLRNPMHYAWSYRRYKGQRHE